MNHQSCNPTDWERQNKRNTRNLALWTAGWLLSTALAAFGPGGIWEFSIWSMILVIVINLSVGFAMILVNKRLLQGLDELQQKIQLGAMGLSLGVGLVVGVGFERLEDAMLINFDPDISHLMILMAVTYIVGIIIGHRRYQ